MSTHRISVAQDIRSGGANPPNRAVSGVPMANLVYETLTAPAVADVDALIKAATSTELPNNETVTYTFPGSASPVDGVDSDGVLDVARNIICQTTHASSIVAMTVLVTGRDIYNQVMSELITVAATGTDESDVGKKAFKTITSIAIASAGNAESNTLNVGFGDVLGLSYRLAPGGFIAGGFNGVKEATQGTVVAADATTATTTTGDIRGTYDPNGTLDGTKDVTLTYVAKNGPLDSDGFGVTQA